MVTLVYSVQMTLPTKTEARALLNEHVIDTYQRFHAEMVGRAVEGYAEKLGEDTHLWWLTGYLHDIDYDQHPTLHPGPSLDWFKLWDSPKNLSTPLKHTPLDLTALRKNQKLPSLMPY